MEPDEIAFEGSWVLVYPDCSLVGVKEYQPYRASQLTSVKFWSRKVDAQKFGRIFPGERLEVRQAFLGLLKVG